MIQEPSTSIASNSQAPQVFLPNFGSAFAIIFLASLLFGCPYVLLRDGATCRHIETGLYILNHHVIPTTNYYWAIDPNYPWLTHELAGDLSFGLAYLLGQLNGVVLIGAISLTLALMWSLQLARLRRLGPFVCWIGFLATLSATTLHWSARPHLVSYLAFLAIYYLSFLSQASLKVRSTLAGIIVFFWINFHGSAFLSIFILLLRPLRQWLGFTASSSPNKWKELSKECIPAAAAAIAIMFNLRGPAIYSYVFGYLVNPEIAQQGLEWRHFDIGLFPGSWAFIFLLFALIALYALAKCLPEPSEALLLVVLAIAGFLSMRMIPYFALVALPAMGPPWQKLRAGCNNSNTVHKDYARRGLIGCGALFILACVFMLVPKYKVQDYYDGTMPVQTVSYLIKNAPQKLGFNFDNWGSYLYSRVHHSIFIDDKTDFYPALFVEDYKKILLAQPGWAITLDRYKLAYALVPKTGALSKALAKDPNWEAVFHDQASIVYFRKTDAASKNSNE